MSDSKNKVDMSLDDIIKINKSEQRQQRGRGAGSRGGRGGLPRGRGRGGVLTRGRGGGLSRGRGTVVRGRGAGLRGRGIGLRGRGIGLRGRGKLVTRGRGGNVVRGRGRGQAVSPLNRPGRVQNLQTRGRGRGRGRGVVRGRKQLVYTNTGSVRPLQSAKDRAQQMRLNKTKRAATLLREKEMALQNLQQAKKNMQDINQALQKTSRETVVNTRRGIPNAQQTGRGRKKLLTSLMRSPSTTRQLINTSVTINNPTAMRGGMSSHRGGQRGGRRSRGWRRGGGAVRGAAPNQDHFTIQVATQNPNPVKREPPILEQLKMLKPAVSTVYKFQKNVFAAPATGISLNDRFATPGSVHTVDTKGRKVYI